MRRRDFLINGSTALAGLVVANNTLYSQIISNSEKKNTETPMKTLLLTNMRALTAAYPQEVLGIQQAIAAFARVHNAGVIDIDQVYLMKTGEHISVPAYPNARLTAIAKEIKNEITSRSGGQLDLLILVGDESIIPMWEVNLDGTPLHTDSFYMDLDGDGLPEVATTRVLGNPEAMQRQLSETTESGGPEATILCSEDTRIHLETQRFLDALAQQGHEVAVLGRGGAERLPQSDLIIHFGHGSPKRLSNRFGESFVSAKSMPMLPRHPIAIVDGCATTPPGSALLRAFLNNGGRAYLGSTATVWGMIPARYTNQLVMHFLDAYEAHPEWTLAKLLTVARARYASVARLPEILLELERTETINVDGDMGTHLMTFLEWHAYGTPFARLHQGDAQSVFAKHSLVETPISLKAKEENAVEATFDLEGGDGQPILFLRADWPNSISSSLMLRIHQNGEVLHELKGDEHIIYQHLEDICVGGYVNGDMYHAYWLLPLQREEGQNQVRIQVSDTTTLGPLANLIRVRQNQVRDGQVNPEMELRVLPESTIEIWPEWETIGPPEEE